MICFVLILNIDLKDKNIPNICLVIYYKNSK